MPKNATTDIKNLGFTPEMFKQDNDGDFDIYLAAILAEQTKILEGRLGLTIYSSVTSPEQDYVKRAEKALVAAELVGRRINIVLNNVVGSGNEISTKNEERQKGQYAKEAEELITRLIAGISSDSDTFASGVLETSHFETTTTIGGLEVC